MRIHDFKTENYFPFHVLLVGGGLLLIGLSMVTLKLFMGGLIVLLIGIIIVTTQYRFRIDLDKKEYQDYIWILGMKAGKRIQYDEIRYIFIKQSQESQTMGLRAATTTIHKTVFDSYLKFSEQEKIHLITRDNRKDLIEKLRPISQKLKTEILDYTFGEPQVV